MTTNRRPPSPRADRIPKPSSALAIGERIQTIRRQRGLTQVQLGSLVGVSGGTISRIESDDPTAAREPSRPLLRSLATVLGVPAHFLEYGVPMAVYVLMRQDDAGGIEVIAAFTDETDADEWVRIAEAAQVDENGKPDRFPPDFYSASYVPINDTETMALFAAERLAEPVTLKKEAKA